MFPQEKAGLLKLIIEMMKYDNETIIEIRPFLVILWI